MSVLCEKISYLKQLELQADILFLRKEKLNNLIGTKEK